MDKIFGSAKNREGGDAPAGLAGLVFIDDAYVELGDTGPESILIAHNTIDRFSGGVMNQRLFTEEVLYGGEITADLTVVAARPKRPKEDDASGHSGGTCWETVEQEYWEAVDLALADLCEGRLALGADGHGYFKLAEGEKPNLSAKLRGVHDRSAS